MLLLIYIIVILQFNNNTLILYKSIRVIQVNQKAMDLKNLSQEQLQELQELMQLKKDGRLKIKGEQKSRQELLAYNHYRQNRVNHYINAMFKTLQENDLINQVDKFNKSINHYLDKVNAELEKNPNAKITKGTKAILPDFAVFEK